MVKNLYKIIKIFKLVFVGERTHQPVDLCVCKCICVVTLKVKNFKIKIHFIQSDFTFQRVNRGQKKININATTKCL